MKTTKTLLGTIILLFLGVNVAKSQSTDNRGLLLKKTDIESTHQLFTLYPNPATSSVQVRSDRPVKGFTLEVFDRSGEKFISKPYRMDVKLDVSKLEAGIYIVRVTKGRESYSQKLVVGREIQLNE